ncbi:MAG: type III-B CRISPR-associated protein Cas10/Cmr2 [Candidatus Poribacteria bacterium]|nr:type III-B CRISPR-associated protein Cas10/Cmr2 [Candidatus Poribacteria bacterium]
MTRDWKTDEPIENALYCWEDLILKDEFGITKKDWNNVIEQTVGHIQGWSENNITERVTHLIDLLLPPLQTLWQGNNGELPFRWLPCLSLSGATVADHALTASAIAYCLAYDMDPRPDIDTLNKIRLSALTAAWKFDGLQDIYKAVWVGHEPIKPKADGTNFECIVHLAKTAASQRKEIDTKDQFNTHPLNQDDPNQKHQIGLVLGGATKIKGYFLESAKLPEIRGASALLDRINLEDIPALFGRKPYDKKRSERIRKEFSDRTGYVLNAPECIIYAAGGSTLAFTPTSVVHQIADEIERIYTKETLVANSVAAGDTFDLLELQYGLKPTNFWIADFHEACADSEGLMVSLYGGTDDSDFLKRKCFGELTTKLAQAQMHRREGNPTSDRMTQRNLPTHVEVGPYQERCESCERRSIIINEPKQLCEACTRKYVVGRITKKEANIAKGQRGIDHYLSKLSGWEPATRNEQGKWDLKDWGSLFKDYLLVTGKAEKYYPSDPQLESIDGPQDLEDIGNASDTEGFIAFIYADGNNMGRYLEDIKTPAQYRQFSERVFVAMQQAAFDALSKHTKPTEKGILPFEIISIGGDDLILIVPGDKALKIAHEIGINFDKAFMSRSVYGKAECPEKAQRYQSPEWKSTANSKLPQFSMSLGFVIANEHTPIAFMEDLAGKLLKSAKSRAKKLKTEVGYSGGTVDFISLKSLSMISSELGDFRKKFYKTDEKNVLTMHPFTLHELTGFIKGVQAFKSGDFPRSQLYQLRQSLPQGRSTSTLEYLYFRSRMDDKSSALLRQEIEQNWKGATDVVGGQGPWYAMYQENENDEKRYETLLLDIIEAYDFISEPDEQHEEDS